MNTAIPVPAPVNPWGISFGANWKTTISGAGAGVFSFLTILSALPYEAGGPADLFPAHLKTKIFIVSAIATLALKLWNAALQKDRAVTGGSVQQTLAGDSAAAGSQTLVDITKASSPGNRVVQVRRKRKPKAHHK